MTIQRWNESHRHMITRSPSLEETSQMELKSYEFKVRGLVWYSGGPKGVRRRVVKQIWFRSQPKIA
jgi:hypothetical protein